MGGPNITHPNDNSAKYPTLMVDLQDNIKFLLILGTYLI